MRGLNNFSELKIFGLGKKDNSVKILMQDNFDYDMFISKIKSREKKSELPIILKALGILHTIDSNNNLVAITNIYPENSKNNTNENISLILELQHTCEDIFTISTSDLHNKILLGEQLNLPLRFAISLNGYWGLFTPDFIESKYCTLTLSDFIGEESKSWFDRELSTCSYMFENQIVIKTTYKKTQQVDNNAHAIQHGELVSYEFFYGESLIFQIDKTDTRFHAFQYILQGLQESVGNISRTIENKDDVVVVTESSEGEEYILVPEYKFMLPCLEHMLHDENKKSFRKNIESEKNPCICVEVVHDALSELVDLGVDIIVLKDFYGYTFDNFKEKFWKTSDKESATSRTA